ncbi:hypothetical protein [Archaeoglobus sp.]
MVVELEEVLVKLREIREEDISRIIEENREHLKSIARELEIAEAKAMNTFRGFWIR